MNFLTEKIKNLEGEKTDSKKLIAESEQSIVEKDKEIKRLEILKERLKKVSTIKYYENLGDVERVTDLNNRINLGDFLDTLSNLLDIRYFFSESNLNLRTLTIWQILFLLFGDFEQPQQPPAENHSNLNVVDPENISFNPNKKFMDRLRTQG